MNTYLFSTFTGLPSAFFDGYCFAGRDYIVGQEGMLQYQSTTGHTIEPGLDGCYISVQQDESGWTVGCDYSGFKKLFYFFNGTVWCISNSVEAIANHLHFNGVHLSPCLAQISAQKISSKITTCLSTFQTVFREVRLLPSYARLRVSKLGLAVVVPSRRTKVDYEAGLSEFIETWISRFETLLVSDRVSFGSQLTGGKDSRTVFSMLHRARQRLGSAKRDNACVISGKSDKEPKDFEIAAHIAQKYGIPIKGTSLGSLPKLTAEQSYSTWRQLSLGLYNPIYFPNYETDGSFILFSGIGGENHRPFYGFKNPEDLIKYIETEHPEGIVEEWQPEFRSTLETLVEHSPEIPPLIAHYREFRSRIHGGRTPQTLVCFPPLSSYLLDKVDISEQRLLIGQVNFDIMQSALPGLIEIDYDKPTKRPSNDNIRHLSSIPIGSAPNPGLVFLGERIPGDGKSRRGSVTRLTLLAKDFSDAAASSRVRTLFGDDWISTCQSTLSAALQKGSFDHAWDGQNITRTLTAAMAFTMGTE
jgi:hypothetical protein